MLSQEPGLPDNVCNKRMLLHFIFYFVVFKVIGSPAFYGLRRDTKSGFLKNVT